MATAARIFDVGTTSSAAEAPAARTDKRRREGQTLLALSDLGSVLVGLTLASIVRGYDPLGAQAQAIAAVVVPLFYLLAIGRDAYGIEVLERWTEGARRSIVALATATLVVLGVGFALKVSAEYSRIVITLCPAFAALLMIGGRALIGRHISRRLPGGVTDIVVLTDGIEAAIEQPSRLIDAAALGLEPRVDCPHMQDRIGRALRYADRVVIACRPERRQAWSDALKGVGTKVEVLIPEVEQLGVLGTSSHEGRLTAVVARGPLSTADRVLKRSFDLLFCLFMMPVLLLITGVVALLIKLEDGGPIFFVQNRIGEGNRLFAMYKFRSMRVNDGDAFGRVSTARGDSRITRIGNFIRKTSIDELPQVFNVLKGDMSVVGPRPHPMFSTVGEELFWQVDRRYWYRHAVKPGLTGLAQVRGFRGATHTERDLTDRVASDLDYLERWSLWRDIRITAATLKVLSHSNAF